MVDLAGNRVYTMSVKRTTNGGTYTISAGKLTVVSDDEWRLTNVKGYTLIFNEVGELQGAENWLGDGVTYLDGPPPLPEFLMISDDEFGLIHFTPISLNDWSVDPV